MAKKKKEVQEPERIGTQGWQQFLASKQEMLYQYELAKKYSESHIVRVSHGNVAEGVFRKWLKTFLPKKYGVTSGYIVSQNQTFKDLKLPHYDVIIYDEMNSPLLWVEENPDKSIEGHTRAIPAEYVMGIIEVKANMTAKSSKEALAKIREVKPLLIGQGNHEEYNGKIGSSFFGLAVFFEVQKTNEFKKELLDNLMSKMDFPFYGGVILKGEGRNVNDTGQIKILSSATKIESTVGKNKESIITGSPLANSIEIASNCHFGGMLTWSPANFSIFAFDIVALLEGRYQSNRASSMYGMSWLNPNRKKE